MNENEVSSGVTNINGAASLFYFLLLVTGAVSISVSVQFFFWQWRWLLLSLCPLVLTSSVSPWVTLLLFPHLPPSHKIVLFLFHVPALPALSMPLCYFRSQAPSFHLHYSLSHISIHLTPPSSVCLSRYTADSTRLMSPMSWELVSCVRSVLLQTTLWNPLRTWGRVLQCVYVCLPHCLFVLL